MLKSRQILPTQWNSDFRRLITLGFLFAVLMVGRTEFLRPSIAQDLSHRKSIVTVRVQDESGNPLSDAVLGIKMKQHAFKFGTQVRDRFFSITESQFNGLSDHQKQSLLPDLTGFGQSRYTPTWEDAENYRAAVYDNFNHVVPTIGMQWLTYNNNGPTIPDAAINQAQANGLSVTGASVVWQRDRWPTPTEFRSDQNPDVQAFHDALIADRLSTTGIMGRFSDAGMGPTINEWKVLNEPLHEDYYATAFVNAGIYDSEIEALTDYFVRADSIRPNSTLSINEFNILNSGNDNAAIAYRDLVNELLAAGAPIDQIGVQAHMARNDVTKADITRRLDILAETGLGIEITEFDSRDDANQLTEAEQEQIFNDVLTASFEHEAVEGFMMWGFWDPGHWRGNGPLFEADWTVKQEGSPWFDLVRDQWMTDLSDLTLDANGQWSDPGGLFNGNYDFTVSYNGTTKTFSGYDITANGSFVLTVPEAASLGLLAGLGTLLLLRRKR